jgi:hypothetical protein
MRSYIEKKNAIFWSRYNLTRHADTKGVEHVGKFGNHATRQSSDNFTGILKRGKHKRKITMPKMPWDET